MAPELMASPRGFEPRSTDRKSVVLDQARRWGLQVDLSRSSIGIGYLSD